MLINSTDAATAALWANNDVPQVTCGRDVRRDRRMKANGNGRRLVET